MEDSSHSDALSVSAALGIAKSLLQEHTFKIIGEVSELSNKSGYKAVYFTIKDEKSALPCLMWKNRYEASGVELSLGAKVEVTGKFSIFAAKGRMNFDVSALSLAGEGDLRQRVARLAKKLEKEGLMSQQRKRSLIAFPERIGLVTSPRGAAVHDVLRTLRRRYPQAEVLFAGVTVEGAHAPAYMIEALNTVVSAGAEEVLLVRGGGSFEDLMPFNDEGLARAIAACPVPVITGIGHEPDTSIADMVADYRASTPTAAAEAVAPHQEETFETIIALGARITKSLASRLARSAEYVNHVSSRPVLASPLSLFESDFQMSDLLLERLERSMYIQIERFNQTLSPLAPRLSAALPFMYEQSARDVQVKSSALKAAMDRYLVKWDQHYVRINERAKKQGSTFSQRFESELAIGAARLNDLSPLTILQRGWSIARTENNAVVSSVEQVKSGDLLKIQVSDGVLDCTVASRTPQELFSMIDWED